MESSSDKHWAQKYLLDPLNAPEPSAETGPGTHFVRPQESKSSITGSVANDGKQPSVTTYPTPPQSASPTQSTFHPSNPYSPSHRQAAFGDYPRDRKSRDEPLDKGKGHRRRSSLGERYPGDMSHRPLDLIRRDTKTAHRSPHLRKKHQPSTDTIDGLDASVFGGAYHHEGPYDATLFSRNTRFKSSPVAAVAGTNEEALKATPRENIRDALDRHVPLSGTATIPPGMSSLNGQVMNYEEGADLMREPDAPGGAYKRWVDLNYHPEDYKGKAEPSFSIERAIKDHDKLEHRRVTSEGSNVYEMQPRNQPSNMRHRSNTSDIGGRLQPVVRYSDFEGDMRRSHSTGKRVGEGLKRRFVSLRRSKKHSDE